MFDTVHRIIYLLVFVAVARAGLDVCLKDMGCLKGTLFPGYEENTQFEAFMGIPFAQPPVAELRLKNPVPAKPWQGILNATEAGGTCLQTNYFTPNWDIWGQEDCLYLNVYRPKDISESKKLPVMVYIYSGGFFTGTSHPGLVGPQYLMDTKEVILVSFNYRLGPFGFLSTGDKHMPGNFGFKDQRLALRWVQKHISSFGGDDNLVTIFGHSAGGVSTHYQMLSENSKGLFHRSMSLSGIGLAGYMSILKDPLKRAQQFAEHLEIPDFKDLSSQELANALRQVDAMALLKSANILRIWDVFPLVADLPVLEEPGSEAFLTEDPVRAHLAGHIHQVPWLLGTTSREGEGLTFLFRSLDNLERLKDFNSKFLDHFAMAINLPEGVNSNVVQDILKLYGQPEIKELNNDTFAFLAGIVGDFHFKYPMYTSAKTYDKLDQVSIYDFDYLGEKTFASIFASSRVIEVGSVHLDDTMHTVGMQALTPLFQEDSTDAKVMKRLTNLLVHFAKTGSLMGEVNLLPCKKEDFTSEEMCNYFRFAGARETFIEEIDNKINTRALDLWKKLYLP